MAPDDIVDPIRTPRLDLVPVSADFAQALVDGDRGRASMIIGAAVSRWFATDSAHVVQLALAEAAAEPGMPHGGRVVVLVGRTGRRRPIGSVGFHGPPDDQGRVEVGCRIHPAYHGRGYGAEATTGLLDWATTRFGVTRFLLAIPPRHEAPNLVPIEIEPRRATWSAEIEGLVSLIEGASEPGD